MTAQGVLRGAAVRTRVECWCGALLLGLVEPSSLAPLERETRDSDRASYWGNFQGFSKRGLTRLLLTCRCITPLQPFLLGYFQFFLPFGSAV